MSTDIEIARVAVVAGFKGQAAVTAVAVALAESSGNAKALSPPNRDGSRDRGLWQINNKAHPEISDAQAFTPGSAAKAAYAISSGGKNWKPWSVYNNRSYVAFVPRAMSAVTLASAEVGNGGTIEGPSLIDKAADAVGLGGAVDGLGQVGNAVSTIASITTVAGEWIGNPHNWVRVCEVLAGAMCVITGLYILGRSGVSGPLPAAARGGTKVATSGARAVGKVVKVAAASKTGGAA